MYPEELLLHQVELQMFVPATHYRNNAHNMLPSRYEQQCSTQFISRRGTERG
jgi:hypothetical protein